VLIVDDEPLARERIRTLAAREPDLDVVGECGDGRSAAEAIRRLAPDLVFLDIQIPELDGFAVLAEAGGGRLPLVIFVTAYDQYAVRAFEVHAVDYLLKPFDRRRFASALARARERLRKPAAPADFSRELRALLGTLAEPARLAIRAPGGIQMVVARDIDWVEAAGNYVALHVGATSHLLRRTLGELEAELPAAHFLRIHRSAIVNLARIRELRAADHGDAVVVLAGGQELRLGRSYRAQLEKRLGKPL